MCLQCWETAGSPTIDTPAVRLAAEAIGEVYDHNCVGGNLHCQLDDWNLDDDFFDPADFHRAQAANIHHDDLEALAAERRCFDLMRGLSETERYSALALSGGLWG